VHDQRKKPETPAGEPAAKRIKTEHKAPVGSGAFGSSADAYGSSAETAISVDDSDSEDEFEPKRAPERKEAAGDGKHGKYMCCSTPPTSSGRSQTNLPRLRANPSRTCC
jgi:hypothetical protein